MFVDPKGNSSESEFEEEAMTLIAKGMLSCQHLGYLVDSKLERTTVRKLHNYDSAPSNDMTDCSGKEDSDHSDEDGLSDVNMVENEVHLPSSSFDCL